MSDLISREAALDVLAAMQGRCTSKAALIQNSKIWQQIKDLPSAEPQWIPVSEGLPKKDGRYQVTRYDYVTNTEFIDILWYEENTWWNRRSIGDYAVIAWMPLPKAYQEADHE